MGCHGSPAGVDAAGHDGDGDGTGAIGLMAEKIGFGGLAARATLPPVPTAALPPPGAIVELVQSWRRYARDPDAAIRAITEEAARALGVARASVWLLDEAAAGLVCIDLHDAGTGRHTSGTVLRAFDFPAYFAAIAEEDALAVADAHADPRTAELSAPYLRPLGINARLDATIRTGRRLVGVLCYEHVGAPRTWTVLRGRNAVFLGALTALVLRLKDPPAGAKALLPGPHSGPPGGGPSLANPTNTPGVFAGLNPGGFPSGNGGGI